MDDIGNIIYIIIVIISLIAGAWQKANKEKPAKPYVPEMDEPEVVPSFEEERRSIFKEVDQVVLREREQAASERLRLLELKAEEAKSARGKKRAQDTLTRRNQELTGMQVESDEIDLSDFDARKAVIYSEILNPPYL
jgi:hypothetical protein